MTKNLEEFEVNEFSLKNHIVNKLRSLQDFDMRKS